jgi:hypothetical protein
VNPVEAPPPVAFVLGHAAIVTSQSKFGHRISGDCFLRVTWCGGGD